MRSDKISIIVPVYKVENYINRCVSSLLGQTYGNIEIILVDDGSPDKCPQICDKWREKDSRIKVVHKKNGGLSDARNVGLKYATGEYICFVDSDDWVADTFVEKLYRMICNSGVQISAIGIQEMCEEEIKTERQENSDIYIYIGEQAIKELFSNETYANYAWNKMYRRRLFDGITYPVGRKMEDLGTTYKLIIKAENIAYSSEKLYYYFQRENSILHTVDREFYVDKLSLSLERYKEIDKHYPDMYENKEFMINTVLELYPLVYSKQHVREWKEFLAKVRGKNLIRMERKTAVKYFLFEYCNILYFLYQARKMKLYFKQGVK